MNKRLASVGLAAGLLTGGAAGLVLGINGVSSAADAPAVTDDTSTTVADDTGTTDAATDPDGDRPGPGEWVSEALQPLIDDGTLTEDQAAAVITALEDARPLGGHAGDVGHGGHGGHGHGRGLGSGAAADALGMTRDELRDAIRGGRTIAEIAADRGVELQSVIDAMVASAQERLDDKVADGTLTHQEADARLAEITERINDLVNRGTGS